jgi:arginyl-tRNA synthetase
MPSQDLSAQGLAKIDTTALVTPEELALIKGLAGWPREVEAAALAQAPHRIAFFLMELAGLFHTLWNKGNDNAAMRFIVSDDPDLTLARLVLIKATQTVIASGLAVMGCEALEELRNDQPDAA